MGWELRFAATFVLGVIGLGVVVWVYQMVDFDAITEGMRSGKVLVKAAPGAAYLVMMALVLKWAGEHFEQ